MKRFKYCIFLFVVNTFVGCTNPTTAKIEKKPENEYNYFDIDSFLDEYLNSMDAAISIKKTLTVDDVSESKKIDFFALSNEFNEFRRRNINRPRFFGKFEKQINHEHQNIRHHYKANDPKLKIRSYSIEYKKDSLQSIHIVEHYGSALGTQDNVLNFWTDRGFLIQLCDSLILLGKSCKSIELEYIQ